MGKLKDLLTIDTVEEVYAAVDTIKAQNEIAKKRIQMAPCRHLDTEYQPKEDDTNTQESITCAVCGKDLPLPQPDDEI